MQHHKPWQLLREQNVPAIFNSRDFTCTSLTPRPMTVVFGLGTRLRVHMHTLENGGPTQWTGTRQSRENFYRPG